MTEGTIAMDKKTIVDDLNQKIETIDKLIDQSQDSSDKAIAALEVLKSKRVEVEALIAIVNEIGDDS